MQIVNTATHLWEGGLLSKTSVVNRQSKNKNLGGLLHNLSSCCQLQGLCAACKVFFQTTLHQTGTYCKTFHNHLASIIFTALSF